MATQTTNLNLTKPGGDEDAMIIDINDNMDKIDAAVAGGNITVSIEGLSALPRIVTNSAITANHQVVSAFLSNQDAMADDDWTYQTGSGSITIYGTISGETDLSIYLAKIY